MKSILLTVLFIPILLAAQPEAPNKVDSSGKKQGQWIKMHENDSVIMYRGNFRDDKPVGTFFRYYEDGALQAVIEYESDEKARAKIYYPGDSLLMAEGIYNNEKRDSVWLFYTPEGSLASRESFINGKKNGLSEIYYQDGSLSELIEYTGGVKNGRWEQYFNDGNPKLKATIKDGIEYVGNYESFYPDGSPLQKGKYVDGKKESSWYDYNDDGSIHIIVVYRGGKIFEEYPKNGVFETYWPNDIKKSEFTFKDGKKDGPFKEYYNQGEWRTEEVEDEFGEKRPVQRLYGTQLMREGKFKDDKWHGIITEYTENGKIKSQDEYNMGEKVK